MFALFLTFPFHISVTFPLSTCQKPSASGVAVQTSVWRRHIMMFRLRSHLFSHHVLAVGQVNCRRNSSAARIICLYHMSTWCVLNAYSIIFKYDSSHIFQHFFHMLAESSLFSNKRPPPSFFSLFLSPLVLCSFSSGATLPVWPTEWMEKNHWCVNGCLVSLLC